MNIINSDMLFRVEIIRGFMVISDFIDDFRLGVVNVGPLGHNLKDIKRHYVK